ncbi:MAG: hypothetical protein ABIJ08_00435 [Nanoarchaeota archaeon]
MDIVSELKNNQTILVLMPSVQYNDVIVDMAKNLSENSVCYVTLNKTYDSLKELFTKSKVDVENIVFIDAISKSVKKTPDQADGCYYVSSPGALTEISLVISKFLRHEFEYMVFDSLTNLMIYAQKAPVAKFISSLINKIRGTKTKAVFYALGMEAHNELIKECEMFVDKVIQIK